MRFPNNLSPDPSHWSHEYLVDEMERIGWELTAALDEGRAEDAELIRVGFHDVELEYLNRLGNLVPPLAEHSDRGDILD